jgi:hypothetical protein
MDKVPMLQGGVAVPGQRVPNLVQFLSEHVMKPGYDYGDEFEYGRDLILDALETHARRK